jgi:hypothetical protein
MPCTDAVKTSPLLVSAASLAVLLAACGSESTPEAPSTTSPVLSTTSAAPSPAAAGSSTTAAPSTVTVTAQPPQEPSPTAPTHAEPGVPVPCGNGDLTVAAGPVAENDTLRTVNVTFTNTSAQMCVLVGYPGADLVTAAGGILVHVERRPANAAPRLELQPGDVATADVQASAVDTTNGTPCGRIGTLQVTAPNTTQSHLLPVNLPICGATISSVG